MDNYNVSNQSDDNDLSNHFWDIVWVSCGKPRQGVVHQIMKHTKHKYHYTVRTIKRRDADLRKSRMAKCLTTKKKHRDFWKEPEKDGWKF